MKTKSNLLPPTPSDVSNNTQNNDVQVIFPQIIEPQLCPLCKKENACLNLSCGNDKANCWCTNPNISFPQPLLDSIPASAKGIACICQTCALKYQTS